MFDFANLRVLVVEDTDAMRNLMANVLALLGVGTVLSAGNGERGFEIFRKESPDIVLADWHMTPMDGIELTRLIRRSALSSNRMAPVILVTGYSAQERVAQARDVGVTEFLVKPFSANDLANRLAYVINKPRDFVDCGGYFGPDRRRRNDSGYTGPGRRQDEEGYGARPRRR